MQSGSARASSEETWDGACEEGRQEYVRWRGEAASGEVVEQYHYAPWAAGRGRENAALAWFKGWLARMERAAERVRDRLVGVVAVEGQRDRSERTKRNQDG